jgi:predicted O-methyltransferase YrrM
VLGRLLYRGFLAAEPPVIDLLAPLLGWRSFYERADAQASADAGELTKAALKTYARGWRFHPRRAMLRAEKARSMLHQQTLTVLWYLALRSRSAVLEIGPYIGGSTAVIGYALRGGPKVPFVTIEPGGTNPDHPLPTDDILADLKAALRERGLAETVHVVEGSSWEPQVMEEVAALLDGRAVDLLFIDADGDVAGDLERYRPHLRPGSVLVLDDYTALTAPEKQSLVNRWVDEAVAEGTVEDLGVYLWGTWVGRYLGPRQGQVPPA